MVKLVKAAIAASGEECVLAIVDTMARCFPGLDLDVPANMSIVARRLEELRDAIGRPCVACVHHTGHPGSTDRKIKLRGGYQLACDVDAVLGFNRDETTRITTISIDKERDLEDGARLAFSLLQKNLGTDQDNEPITSCVVIEEDVPLPAAGKPKKPRTAAEHFADLVKDAMAVCGGKHQIGNKRNGAWITAAVRHDSDDFCEYLFSRGFINRDENPGTISSRISRGRRVALEKGLICADETHVWVM
jgi:hypothetical protein